MIIVEAEQGSQQWFEARMGIPTASEFHRIIQPGGEPRFKKNGEPYKSKAGEPAEGRWGYAYELAVERLLGESKDTIDGLRWVERGKALEGDAVQHFEFVTDCRTAKCGFVMPDHKRFGCSPDRILVDELGGLELKVPAPATHLRYFIEGPGAAYKCQVQGSMYVTGFPVWYFMSYSPNLPQVLIKFERDEEFIEKIAAALDQFCGEIDEVCEKVRQAGYVPPAHLTTPTEAAYGEMMRSDMNAAGHIIEQSNWGG